MMENRIIRKGNFDQENYIFKTISNIPLEELYIKSNQKIEKNKDNQDELIEEGGYIYLFNKPHRINFILPDGKNKEIFLANISQLMSINEKFGKDNVREISNDGITYARSSDISESFSNKYIRYVNSAKDKKDYNITRRYKTDVEKINLEDLSVNYEIYLENSNLVSHQGNFFVKTDERKEFFNFLDFHLSSRKVLALCGLKGIGKTASILAYLKCYKLLYFYFNVKAIDKLLRQNEKQKIIKIILREMYNFFEDFEEAESYYNGIKKILENNHSVMDILREIIQYIEYKIDIIVIDQYKTKYDNNYSKLLNIINNNKNNKIIVVSSMNEDDVRKSIIISIKNALNLGNEKPKLDYYYIIKLVEVSENDKNKFNEEQKKLLNEFGNLYIYYYKIQKKISKNPYKSFKKEIENEMSDKIKEYFTNKSPQEMIKIFEFLIMEETHLMNLKDCYKIIDDIPLRYFFLKYNDKNIIQFSGLEAESKVSFNCAFNYIREYFLFSFQKIIVDKKNNLVIKNIKVNQESINLEKYFGYFLWGFRGLIKINHINIVSYQKVNSIFEIKDEYISKLSKQLDNLKQNKSILILQNAPNAKFFDVGILEKKNNYYNLYLIQITLRKDADERVTITGLIL